MKDYPKISIIIPSYNQGKYIERTLLSILRQNYNGGKEIIVSDGGSTDQTVDILKRYNIIWWSEKDKGFSDAVNKGLKIATGEIVAIQSSDDYYLQGTFQKAVKYLTKFPELGFVSGNDIAIDINNRILRVMLKRQIIDTPLYFLRHGYIPQHATFIRRKAIDRIGGLKITCDQCGDADLFYRILHFYDGLMVRDLFSVYQVHQAQRTQNDPHLWIASLERMINECKEDPNYSRIFNVSPKIYNEFIIYEKLLWEHRSGNKEKAISQLEEVMASNMDDSSDWFKYSLQGLNKQGHSAKTSIYDKLFEGKLLNKIYTKLRLYSIKLCYDLNWYR